MAKPRPESPARAASTEPLTASMPVCTAISAMPSTIFSILRPMAAEIARWSRCSTACRRAPALHAVRETVDRRAAALQRRVDVADSLVRVTHVGVRELRGLLDLRQRGRRLMRRGRLHAGRAVDLLHGRHDLRRRARELLDRRG